MRLVACALLALSLLAGCTSNDDGSVPSTTTMAPAPALDLVAPQPSQVGSTVLAAASELTLGSSHGATLQPGTGWGRLAIHAADAMTLTPKLGHTTIKDFDTFSDDGDGIYNQSAYTFFFLYEEGESPMSGYYFYWWGTPDWSVWPSGSFVFDITSVSLSAGDTAILLVATSVPNYSIKFGGGPDIEWNLEPNPALQLFLPNMTKTEVAEVGPARVAQQRGWHADAPSQPPGILVAQAWDDYDGVGARAGIYSDAFGWRDAGVEAAIPAVPLPAAEYSTGGYGHSRTQRTGVLSDPANIEFYREIFDTGVDVLSHQEGAAFLTIPDGTA